MSHNIPHRWKRALDLFSGTRCGRCAEPLRFLRHCYRCTECSECLRSLYRSNNVCHIPYRNQRAL